MTRRARFWPVFAVGVFLVNVCVIGVIIYIAITKASPVDGPAPPPMSGHPAEGTE